MNYLYFMWKKSAILALLVWCYATTTAQTTYLLRSDLMALADSCLKHTYNFSFTKARQFQQVLDGETPEHPAPPFLEALIIYWEHFPLTPENEASEQFIRLMDQCIMLAGELIEKETTCLEGIFFDLFGRAFKAMFWADNGKSGKVVPDLRTMYNHTREGFHLKDSLNEFYFTTGLYNYYVEAYPDAHPVYKPLLSFMQEGDRELGLIQLNHAINHTTYLRVEALLFMSLIQLNYEDDLNTASIYAARLHREYPQNVYYQGHLVTILLHLHRYDQVNEIIGQMKAQEDSYSEMIRLLAGAFQAEKRTGDDQTAGKQYRHIIALADSVGPYADNFKAMGYMGLSRLFNRENIPGEARKYARKASNYTAYKFILDER